MRPVDDITTYIDERPHPLGTSGAAIDAGDLSRRLVLSVREAASLLGISKDLAYELVRRDELPSLRLGRRLVVPTRPLLKLLGVEAPAVAEQGRAL